MNWDDFRNEWSDILADNPELEEAIFLMVQALLGEQYTIAFEEGREEGYGKGYDEGRDSGYNAGYDDGSGRYDY